MKLPSKKTVLMILLSVTAVVISFIIIISLLVKYHPVFGGVHSQEKVEIFHQSGHYEDGHFVNQIATSLDMDFGEVTSMMKDYLVGIKQDRPEYPLPVLKVDPVTLTAKADSIARLTWFGHSAFLLEIDNKNILLDPMLGDVPSPFPWLGSKRFTEGLPIEIEQLPQIDAVIFSHDHYDHLDYGTVLKIKDKVQHFFVPLGVGSHLQAWGIDSARITENNWWDENEFKALKIICTPARHFSGRFLFDRNTTLWASWIIIAGDYKIYFSGDSGYGPHFKAIGDKYGPFDFVMMECGQYDLRWEDIHLLPEQTVRAAFDLQAKQMMPIHWGAFVLGLHAWNDPVIRLSKKATEMELPFIIPQIGKQINLHNFTNINSGWWQGLQ